MGLEVNRFPVTTHRNNRTLNFSRTNMTLNDTIELRQLLTGHANSIGIHQVSVFVVF